MARAVGVGEGKQALMDREIRIGIITAWPEADWHSQRLIASLARRADARALDPAQLAAIVDEEGVSVTAAGQAAAAFDAFVLARGMGRAGDPDVQFEIYRALEAAGAIVVNRVDPLLAAQDKFRSSCLLARAGVNTPRAAAVQTMEDAGRALELLVEAVVKPVAGSLGEGVERVGADEGGRAVVRERLARDGAVYLQEYVPHPGRDVRVFVVGGRARAAIARQAPPGEWRTNVAIGGRTEAVPLAPGLASVAEAAAGAVGLDYAGIDSSSGRGAPP